MYDIHVLAGTTASDGSATVDTARPIVGEVVFVEVDGAALSNGADLTLKPIQTKLDGTTELGESIINHGDVGNSTIDTLYPRRLEQDNTGSAIAVATGVNVSCLYFVAGWKLRATVANGGDTKAFRIRIVTR